MTGRPPSALLLAGLLLLPVRSYRIAMSFERQRESLGPDHPDTIISLYNLAHAHNELGEVEKAEDAARWRVLLPGE